MLEIDISFEQGDYALSLQCHFDQKMTGIFGESGAGKSTLLHLIAGLYRPKKGRIVLNGITLFDHLKGIDLPSHQRKIALVFQDARLFPHFSIERNLRYGEKRLSPIERRFDFEQVVDLLAISHLLKRRPHQLSGGERQRVALGRAILSSPQLLLCDEPLAALDQGLKQQIIPFLWRIKEKLSIPILYVSHDLNEILQLTDHLMMMNKGRVVGIGHLMNLLEQKNTLSLLHPVGLLNVLPMYVKNKDKLSGRCVLVHHLSTTEEKSSLLYGPPHNFPIGTKVNISIRPEDIAISTSKHQQISIQNQLQGVIRRIIKYDERYLIEVFVGKNLSSYSLLSEITLHAMEKLQLKVDKKVWCLLKSHAIRIFQGEPKLK